MGICGVDPSAKGKEVILGDVIISEGVIQYDRGRQLSGRLVRYRKSKHCLGRPHTQIRSLLARLNSRLSRKALISNMASNLAKLKEEAELGAEYPGVQRDWLFESTYHHTVEGKACEEGRCTGKLVQRRCLEQATLNGDTPQSDVHIGVIGSGDSVMKDAQKRDVLAQDEEIIGFEMEGAGVWDQFPCVVIKGASDFADSHKPQDWQEYAAATAAACAKAVLSFWVPSGTCKCYVGSAQYSFTDPLRGR